MCLSVTNTYTHSERRRRRADMCAATLLLLAALPSLAGRAGWCAGGEVVSLGAAGGGPVFSREQSTAVLAPLGRAATLDCYVEHLRDKSVSWVRSRDLQILSHAGAVFTADARVSASSAPTPASAPASASASRHSLHIERLRAADAGRYECQVNTEPKMSLFFNLTVVDEPVAEVEVSVLGEQHVRARAGGAATLACVARYVPPPRQLPAPSLDMRWLRAGRAVNLQGGVALDTARWAARVESRLTLAGLQPGDAGAYCCSAGGQEACLDLILVDDDEERVEAMQRDEAAAGGGARNPLPARLSPLLLLALLLLLARR